MRKLSNWLIVTTFICFGHSYSQGNLYFKDGHKIYIPQPKFKNSEKIYFVKMDTLFWVSKSEIEHLVKFKEWTTNNKGESTTTWDTLKWDNIIPKIYINNYTKLGLIKKYANRSSAGIVMTLVVPSVTSVLALQQGVVEIAYVGLASSVIGIGLWLSGINQLRTALELGEAIHYTH